ncbi:hypothetical protein [Aquisphaera insulae]|uniref:hypothetical protein n=1 Tax=Aquisphaera insulae TaxID=2712864 RepID=UPI0020300D29|nr:hypothetical protein [Aquisphaera insulae]
MPVETVPVTVMTLREGVLRYMRQTLLRTLVTPLVVLAIGSAVVAQQKTAREVERLPVKAQEEPSEEGNRPTEAPPTQTPRRLRDAVERFNASAPRGKDEPLLTDEEVIASIRGWIRTSRPPISDEGYEIFQEIAKSGELPPGASLTWTSGWDGYRGFHFDVWWIDLSIPTGRNQSYAHRVREHMIRSRILNEVERRRRDQERGRIEKARPDVKP